MGIDPFTIDRRATELCYAGLSGSFESEPLFPKKFWMLAETVSKGQKIFPGPSSTLAEDFIQSGAWVSHLVLAEAIWVLESAYNLSPKQIAIAIEMLLEHTHLLIQDSDVVSTALGHFRKNPSIEFSDCLILEIARKAGHTPLGTFDRKFSKLNGVCKI